MAPSSLFFRSCVGLQAVGVAQSERRSKARRGSMMEGGDEPSPRRTPINNATPLLRRRFPFATTIHLKTSLWSELGGAVGDLGTYIPIVLALTLVSGIDLGSTLVYTALYNIATGLLFGIPMPVQPMKSIAAVAISEGLSVSQIAAAGLSTAAVLFVLGATGLMSFLYRFIPLPVVRGVQLSQGLSFAFSAINYIRFNQDFSAASAAKSGSPRPWLGLDGLILALPALIFLVLLTGSGDFPPSVVDDQQYLDEPSSGNRSRRRVLQRLRILSNIPAALMVFLFGLLICFLRDPSIAKHLKLGPSKIHLMSITWHDWKTGFVRAAIPQIPLSILNSVIAVCKLSGDLFPDREVSAAKVSVSVGVMNWVGCWFGAMPVCHGAGGLAGQYRFGGRSGASVVFLGVGKLVLGLLFGNSFVRILNQFPIGILGVLLLFAGIELAMASRDMNSKEESFVMLVCAAVSLTGSSAALGFGSGILLFLLMKLRRYSDMDVIRALHMANNDPTAAINIIFDTPDFGTRGKPDLRASPETARRVLGSKNSAAIVDRKVDGNESKNSLLCSDSNGVDTTENVDKCSVSIGTEWWLLGCGEVAGMSTCKGRKVRPSDEVIFTFPVRNKTNSPLPGKVFGRGRHVAACSDIVRFSTKDSGEIGRIPNEWARCLLPLVREEKIRIEGFCKSAPQMLSIMDTIVLSVSIHINCNMFRKRHQISLKAASNSTEESIIHPLPTLFRLLGLTPFKEAEFTPGDLYTRKRPLNSKDSTGIPVSSLHVNQKKNLDMNGCNAETEESISDTDLENIVGVGDCSDLQEMDSPRTLQCELRPYQKQALFWMIQLEKGQCVDEAASTLHPCWDAYHLADKRNLVVYVNAFSGDATTEFPSTLEMARGGILADAMGLGKTIMTISLLLAHSERGGSGSQLFSVNSNENSEVSNELDQCPDPPKKTTKLSGFVNLMKQKNSLTSGGNLIICPMTLLGQWKSEIETHAEPGALSLYIHYGQNRPKDVKTLAQSDVVITTYGVLASEFSAENADDSGGLYAVRWFRVVLDEAHTIKSSKSQISMAAAALTADRRWCLTGTPIQNNLEDIYSLLRFLRVEPWGNWAWWNKLIQKPFEEGDERGLRLVQSILKPIMLRRTKSSTDREGRPILVLPPADVQVVYCEQTEAEKDFYEALFKRSKVKFDQFVEQGRVLHNYASILELLLRLRQCCDHPFLVMSRGDTQEFSDLNKLAKRFLKGCDSSLEGEAKDVPSRAYIQEVVEELRKGEHRECPICLEALEDAVLTPCAHRICRECLLASWRSPTSGLCPVCRKSINRLDLITAPTDSRFQLDVEKNWVESSKVSILLHELEKLRLSGSKSIVFSQWTAFLDLLQIPFARNNIQFLRLDGTVSQLQREKVIKQFSEGSNIMVLLMSLKAGGVGINLTAASSAFVLDPWWNPAVEEQAVMRIHRIGQTKRVTIKRFIVKGTVEERMEAVQARKQRMISGALIDEEVRTARIEELKLLFT